MRWLASPSRSRSSKRVMCASISSICHINSSRNEATARGQFALQGVEQSFTVALSRLLANSSTSCGGRSAVMALTMARADWPCKSLTTTPRRMPPSVSTLCRRFFSDASWADQFQPLTRDQAQLAHHCSRYERSTQQSGSCEGGQPLCIADIGLSTRIILDMPGIDDQCTNACRLQCGIRTLKVKCPCFPSPLDGS